MRNFGKNLSGVLILAFGLVQSQAQDAPLDFPPPSAPPPLVVPPAPPNVVPGQASGPPSVVVVPQGSPQTPPIGPQGNSGQQPGAIEGILKRLPDPTASYPLSPDRTDIGGLYVPNLLPGITGGEFREGAGPAKPPEGIEDKDGFYFSQDLLIVQPNFQGTLQLNLQQAPWNVIPQSKPAPNFNFVFPKASLEWVVSPTFDFGYRLPGGQGEFALNYQFLVSQGSANGTFLNIPSTVKSRISQNEVDLLYRSPWKKFGPRASLNYEIGAKLGFFYYDTVATTSVAGGSLGQASASNYSYGGGPRFRYDGEYALTEDRSWVFWHGAEISAVMGQIQESFSNTIPGYPFTVNSGQSTNTVPIMKIQTGIQWAPKMMDQFFIRTGLEWDQYWNLGNIGQSSGTLQNIGLFLQGRYDF
jgi:hypothetical protein